MLLYRTFEPLVLIPCLCLSPPAQHTETSRDRTQGQCPVGGDVLSLGTVQNLPSEPTCSACRHQPEVECISREMVLLLPPHPCDSITSQSSREQETAKTLCLPGHGPHWSRLAGGFPLDLNHGVPRAGAAPSALLRGSRAVRCQVLLSCRGQVKLLVPAAPLHCLMFL